MQLKTEGKSDVKTLVKIVTGLSSSAQIMRSLASINESNIILPEEKKLKDFLETNNNIKGLSEYSSAYIEYQNCVDEDIKHAQRTDRYFEPSSCSGLLNQYFKFKKECIKQNSTNNIEDIGVNPKN